MLKKLLFLLAAVLMLSGCKESDTVKNNATSDSEALKSAEDVELSDEEALNDMCGLYVSSEYMDEFRKTKSGFKAEEYAFLIYIHKTDSTVTASFGDTHQSGGDISLIPAEHMENGKYCFKSDGDRTVQNVEMLYTPGENILECKTESEYEALSTGGAFKTFERFDSYDDFLFRLTKILIGSAEGVICLQDSGKVYITIDGTEYTAEVMADFAGYGMVDIDYNLHDGMLWLEDNRSKEGLAYLYSAKDDNITIFDIDGDVFGVIEYV